MSARRRMAVVGLCALAYLGLGGLIAVHATDPIDDAAQRFFWPHREWGPFQAHIDHTVNVFSPMHLMLLVLAVAVLLCAVRRSLLPIVLVAGIGLPTALAELATKWLLPRVTMDPTPVHFGGTYPSGHVVAVTTLAGALLIAVRRRTRAWQWSIVALLGVTMGVAVQVTAIHQLTDVLGAGLLSAGALISGTVLRCEIADPRGPRRRAAEDRVARA